MMVDVLDVVDANRIWDFASIQHRAPFTDLGKLVKLLKFEPLAKLR